MTKVVGVRFRQVGKIYFFAPGKYSVETGQHVIVETARGVEYGQVVLGEREVEDTAVIQPLKAIIRVATPEDDERELKNREKEKEAFKICLEKIAKHNLDMKLLRLSIHLTIIRCCSILLLMEELISESLLRILLQYLRQALN